MKKSRKLVVSLIVVFAFMLLFMTKSEAKTPYDSITFDGEYYLNNYPDLRNAFGNNYGAAYNHYLTCGIREGRNASPYFDVKYYFSIYDDLQNAFKWDNVLAYNHFVNNGIKEGRSGSPYIDPKYYLDNYKDLREAFGKNYEAAYNHFYNNGIREGRRGSKFFDVRYYLNNYPDLQNAFGKTNYPAAFTHYLNNGINEGRNPSQDVNIKCYLGTYKDLQSAYGKTGYKSAAEHCYTFTIGRGENRITNHKIVKMKDVEPTCLKTGSKGGEKCQNCGEITKQPSTVKTVAHKWTLEKVEWVSGEEGTKAQATMKCTVANHEDKTTDVTFDEGKQTKAPDCEKEGEKTYSDITVKYDGKTYNYDKTLTTSISALGHIWTTEPGSMSGVWSGTYDNPKAIITRTCLRSSNDIQTAISVEYKVLNEKKSTCAEPGSITYCARAKFEGDNNVYEVTALKFDKENKNSNTYETPAEGHKWRTTINEEDIVWNNVEETNGKDEATLTATIKCSINNSHTQKIEITTAESENGVINVEEVPANCGNNGSRTYTAIIKYTDPNGKDTFVDQDESIHTYTYQEVKKEIVLNSSSSHLNYVWEEIDDNNDGILNYKCSGCGNIDKTIARVTNKAGLKAALESEYYQTIEIANNISDLDEVITINKDVKIVSASDGNTYKLVGSAENIFKVTGKSVEFNKINLSGGSNGAILAENEAKVKASNTVTYETESYELPFVLVNDRNKNITVTVSDNKIEGKTPKKLVKWTGEASTAFNGKLVVSDTIEEDNDINEKYYYINDEYSSKFAKIVYTSDRSSTGGSVTRFERYYDLKENSKNSSDIEPPENLQYVLYYKTNLVEYKIEKYIPFDTVIEGEEGYEPGKVPVPKSSKITYRYNAKLIGTVDETKVTVVTSLDELKNAIKVDSDSKEVIAVNGSIDLGGDTLEIQKPNIKIVGHIKNLKNEVKDGEIKGKIEVKAYNVIIENLTIIGNTSDYVVTVNNSGFKSTYVTYKSNVEAKGLLKISSNTPTSSLYFNEFKGENAETLLEFDHIDQEVIKQSDKTTKTAGTKIVGNVFESSNKTKYQIVISDINDVSTSEGETARVYLSQNKVDIANCDTPDNHKALKVKAKNNATIYFGSVDFIKHLTVEGADDTTKNAKQKANFEIDNSENASNFKIELPYSASSFTKDKWSSSCTGDVNGVTITQNSQNYNGNGVQK